MDYPHLNNAPIVEAIVDIQCIIDTPSNNSEKLKAFETAYRKIRDTYPTIEPQIIRSIHLPRMVDDRNIDLKELQSGFFFKSQDTTRVVQFRINGFALSHLKPYHDWPTLIGEAKHLWGLYLNLFQKIIVQRVATRFINKITVPYPLRKSDDYLKELKTPLTDPRDVSQIRSFTEQISSIELETDTSVNFIRAMELHTPDISEASVILDIDVFKKLSDLAPDNPIMWDIVESFRNIKNKVFFGAIGPKTIEKYK